MDFLFGGSVLNPDSNAVAIVIPKLYGLVVLIAVANIFMLLWMARNVGKARKLYKVEYPTMYSPTNDMFNCIQRAHQRSIEGCNTFLTLLLIGGLEMPVLAFISGIIYISGKITFAKGYYTGDPKNRNRGDYYHAGLLFLLIATIKFGIRLITF